MTHTVLFLCTGNYYRSRYAEMLFNHLAGQAGLDWVAGSAGVAIELGIHNVGPMSVDSIAALRLAGVPVNGNLRYPRQVAEADLEAADLIVALSEKEHRGFLAERFPGWEDRVTYWHVDDLYLLPPDRALPAIERETRALIAGLRSAHRTSPVPAKDTPGAARAVLWDLDGTLVDTAPAHWRTWRAILADEGRDLTWEEFAPTFGLRNDQALPLFLGPRLSPVDVERIGTAKEALFRAHVRREPPTLLPGAARWIARLQAAGWRQAIATMAPRLNLEALVDALGIERYLDTTVAAEEVQAGKPDPQVFLQAAARLDLPPTRCVVVEDSPAGVEAARRAGMRCIGVDSRGHGLTADLVVSSLDGLPRDAFDRLVGP